MLHINYNVLYYCFSIAVVLKYKRDPVKSWSYLCLIGDLTSLEPGVFSPGVLSVVNARSDSKLIVKYYISKGDVDNKMGLFLFVFSICYGLPSSYL